ncbi:MULTISPECIES: DUF4391 domain-containing protein [unclassified Sphingomonas]|uniref:DUF4391 domain-containing protein n=1 Tax=unclassified Sphingomonas TaxID=196159 RepID=UPI000E759944|nr:MULTISPECIES: DUF4391 domain-containing protein [unclassified Sphingomonas]RKE45887.1 uncharacterized protein DUF4391 [Sphingomonas sp. PP-CC-1A-547]TCM06835.1 uncharacterized protein DUF4391 [Sphingomonas sp. PP-CC-3G-468]
MMLGRLFDALALPASAQMERRVPKALLAEHGASSAGDRKLVDAGIERLRWRATLKPATIGVPAMTDETRDYAEIAVLTLETRAGANAMRLARIAHSAIPYPLILITGTADAATISVAPKRRHERHADRFVIERLVLSPDLEEPGDEPAAAFMASLAVADLPAASLWSLYEGIIDRIEACAAARITGEFRLPANAHEAETRRRALGAHDGQVREVARLRKAAAAEKRLSTRVALSHTITGAEAELRRLTHLLA